MMGTAAVLGGLLVWTLCAAGAAAVVWRAMESHRKVYVLIGVSAAYSAGVFVLYDWLVRG